MVIEVADHPFIILRELVVTLPEAAAVLTLESTPTPDPSWFGDGVVQSSLVEDLMDGCVADFHKKCARRGFRGKSRGTRVGS